MTPEKLAEKLDGARTVRVGTMKEGNFKEFIPCYVKGCGSRMRYDDVDRQYTCGSCDATLKSVVTPNESPRHSKIEGRGTARRHHNE